LAAQSGTNYVYFYIDSAGLGQQITAIAVKEYTNINLYRSLPPTPESKKNYGSRKNI
jgi:hypothetical protein